MNRSVSFGFSRVRIVLQVHRVVASCSCEEDITAGNIIFMSKQEFTIISAGYLVLFGVIFYFTQCDKNGCGTVAKPPSLMTFTECASAGYPVLESLPRRCQLPDGTIVTEEKTVAVTAPPVDNIKKSDSVITVTEPAANASIGLPVALRGKASVFEGQVHYILHDEDGTVLVENTTDVQTDGTFQVSMVYAEPFGKKGTLEVFESLPASGIEPTRIHIPVLFAAVQAQPVGVYFMNLAQDPERKDCKNVTPFTRRVSQSGSIERTALEELLKGPVESDIRKKAQTSIPSGVSLHSFSLVKGVAKADFTDALIKDVAGICRTRAIRAQIEQTLKQFPSVKTVVISVNGKPDGVLPK
ncbi:MAG: hypothetical protein JWM56_225 [Candidatus Peribacteria bacterium]|nr:hypothetical protein [Candidatus Peribacteria bacterium]